MRLKEILGVKNDLRSKYKNLNNLKPRFSIAKQAQAQKVICSVAVLNIAEIVLLSAL